MPRYAKFIAALIGGAGTSVLTLVAPDSWPYKVAAVMVALATAVAVYRVPNDTEK